MPQYGITPRYFCTINYRKIMAAKNLHIVSSDKAAEKVFRIADHVLRNSEAMKESCYVEMYDIIQWQEAYMLTKLTEQNKRRDNRPNAMP